MRGVLVAKYMLLCLWLVACSGTGENSGPPATVEATAPPQPMILHYNFGTDPLMLDPVFLNNRTSEHVAAQLFEGLTMLDPVTAEPGPGLALEWDVSGDGLTYTFRLRDNARWVDQDGQPVGEVTAEDVVFAIKRACHPDTDAPQKFLLYVVEGCSEVNQTEGIPDIDSVGVRAIERFTVEFLLDQPAAYLPTLLSMPVTWPVPQAMVEQFGDAWIAPEHLVTNGPFLLTSLTDDALVLERNPLYADVNSASIERVEGYRLGGEEALSLYRAGRLDTLEISPEQVRSLNEEGGFTEQLRQVPMACTLGYGFTLVKPPVDNVRVRRALSYAVDRDGLVESVLGAGAIAAHHFAPPGVFGAPPRETGGVGGDATLAQQFLAAAGYPGGVGLPPLTLAYPDNEQAARVASTVAEMWRTVLQVEVTIEAWPAEQFRGRVRSTVPVEEMPHLWLLGWCGSYPDEHDWVYEVFHVGRRGEAAPPREYRGPVTVLAGDNAVRRATGDFDEVVEQAVGTTDPEERVALYAEAERLLIEEEAVFIPLYHTATTTLTRPWLDRTYIMTVGPSLERWTIDMAAKGAPAGTAQPAQ